MQDENSTIRKIGLLTTIALVISNMIGTGVFTSLGFQYKDIPNALVILILWVIGGILALFGALVYSELGAAMPRSGGEYHYLSKIYHPWLGFLSGWVSITVGFAAPVALASMAFGRYLFGATPQSFEFILKIPYITLLDSQVSEIVPKLFAIIILLLVTLIHAYDVKVGGNFQKLFTSFNILLILAFVICGFVVTPIFQDMSVHSRTFSLKDFLKPEIAIALIYISYAYTGWNASAYIASEIKRPQWTIPRSLFLSTLVVTVLYLLLNYTFIITAPRSELILDQNIVNPGLISASHVFGQLGGSIMGILISVLLISTISSMVFVGPRVSQIMGEDMKILKFISFKSKIHGTPVYAIFLQSAISVLLIVTSSFETVLASTGFVLLFFNFLTILGVFIHRRKFKDVERPFKTWGYPIVPILYLLIVISALCFTFYDKPKFTIIGLVAVLSGSIIYFYNSWLMKKSISNI
jgi:basic amino acid/polyamine antiporter, APA family